jgi:hypothetical protein
VAVFSHTLECRYHIHEDTIVLDGLQRISRNDIDIARLNIVSPCHRTKDSRVKNTARTHIHLGFTKRLQASRKQWGRIR